MPGVLQMIWYWWQLSVLAIVNVFGGFCFGYLFGKNSHKPIPNFKPEKTVRHHESDGKLYTRLGFDGQMLDVSNCSELFKNNKYKCKKCGEFYR